MSEDAHQGLLREEKGRHERAVHRRHRIGDLLQAFGLWQISGPRRAPRRRASRRGRRRLRLFSTASTSTKLRRRGRARGRTDRVAHTWCARNECSAHVCFDHDDRVSCEGACPSTPFGSRSKGVSLRLRTGAPQRSGGPFYQGREPSDEKAGIQAGWIVPSRGAVQRSPNAAKSIKNRGWRRVVAVGTRFG